MSVLTLFMPKAFKSFSHIMHKWKYDNTKAVNAHIELNCKKVQSGEDNLISGKRRIEANPDIADSHEHCCNTNVYFRGNII